MPASTFHQSDFRGGEWGGLSQGRSDDPKYKTALNVALNMIPVEEGAATRRSGTEWLGPTYGRTTAKLLAFQSDAALPYAMEFTATNLQFYANTGYVCTNDSQVVTASSSTSGVLTLTTTTNHGWSVGDTFVLQFPTGAAIAVSASGPYLNRVFKATTAATTNLVLVDDLGAAFPTDAGNANTLVGAIVFRILRFPTTYAAADLPTLRTVQANTDSVVLTKNVAPQVVEITTPATPTTDPVFSFGAATFLDGPYLDQQGTFATPETGTVSAYTGSITFTPATYDFVAADVGRHIRLFSQPPAWNSGTTYSYGQTVTDATGAYWTSIAAGSYAALNVGITPGTTATSGAVQVLVWAPAPNEGQWAWGTISAVAGGFESCTVALQTNLNSNNGTTISIWRLGVYQAGQYPTCGIYYEGRLGLAGAVANRLDFSSSNDIFTFSPTDNFGTVLDSSGISETLNSDDIETIVGFNADHQGLIIRSISGEWLCAASALNDPLTPTSIQIHKVTTLGSAPIEAKRVGMVLLFIQRYTQRVMELLADTFSQQFTGKHINENAKHITAAGVTELAYQEEKAPIVWTIMVDGTLAGTSYRRVSHLVQEPPLFSGAHRHAIADGARLVQSMCVLANSNALSDILYLCTYAPGGTDYAVEIMRPIFEDA